MRCVARLVVVGLALLTLVLAMVIGFALGGRASGFTAVPLSGSHLLLVAFAVQVFEPLASRVVPGGYPIALAVSASLVAQFVARNPLVPGVLLAGLGLVLNAAVVLMNGAMPVSLSAAERAGMPGLDLSHDVRHEVLGAATRLPWLADVIPTPLPFRPEIVSVGDVFLAAGIGLFVVASMAVGAAPAPDEAQLERALLSTTRERASRTRGS